ncbi:hypothetical protein vseg_007096 [Gypsophila vaccaria]
MKMRKFSIPSSFISICWFSSLFAICLFSFLYLHPRDNDNCVNILNINNESKTSITSSSSKFVPYETTFNNNNYNNNNNNNNNDVLIIPSVNNITSNNNNNIATSNKIDIVDKIDDVKLNESSTVHVSTSDIDKKITVEDEDEDDDEDTIPSLDVFANPPRNCTREERINWLKEKLQESKLVKSTPRTKKFEEKIQGFLGSSNNSNSNNCRVNVFLTWIYHASLFGKREMFVLESIIKAHRDGCVVILSRTMDSKPGRAVLQPVLDRGYRVLALAPDYQYLLGDTPGQGWLERFIAGEVDPGTVPVTLNLSNLLRLAVLYKYGGVYFDNDMVVLKDVSKLRNTIGIQSADRKTGTWRTISNAMLSFDKGHPLMWRFMEEFAWNFDGFKWGFNGPDLATRVVTKALNDSKYQFNMITPIAFFPIDWKKMPKLFEKPNKNGPNWAQDRFGEINGESYGVHLWNRQTQNLKIEKKCVIGRLISNHCIICQNIYDS